ncbi:MAG TPA: hypothetical protein VKA41_03455 [Solirubrobacterales bacterium]|nr:hypothetical protein [Solirubrobacterales bacterium]
MGGLDLRHGLVRQPSGFERLGSAAEYPDAHDLSAAEFVDTSELGRDAQVAPVPARLGIPDDHDSIIEVDELHDLHGDLTPRVPPFLDRSFDAGGPMEGFRARKPLVLNPLDLGVQVIEQQLAIDASTDRRTISTFS